MRFVILGAVEISAAGRQLPHTAPRHRAVLAYLLLHSGIVISADRLIDAVWGQTPPDTARAQVHAAVTAIRRVLRSAGAAELLETRPAGYVIRPEAGQLDLEEFTGLVAAAQKHADDGDAATAIRELREALVLWRGQPFADINADYVDSARTILAERRLTAVQRLADLELAQGRHEDLIDELTVLVAENPLREPLVGHLMLALHRAGRQADALAVARTFRNTLVEEQGLDPGRAFAALEQAILRDDPDLHAPVSAGSGAGPAEPSAQRPETARAANFLPYDTPDFAGRAVELEQLVTSGSGVGSVTVAAIDGMPGIGKTTLAVHAAHRLADRYPDGQLFVDLQAHTAGQAPVAAEAALEALLRQLGVPAERIPASLSARAALWRAELTGRRVLVVLDNAVDAEHVRALLPGASSSLILITSRRRLTDLDGAHALSMEVLPAADAVDLFTRIVGDRARQEPDAVLDVLRLCGFLPLGVRIAAARLHHRPQWTVAYLAGRLHDHRRRLTELSTSARGVAAAFSMSYQQLDQNEQRLFRLLGLHPGRDFNAYAASALTRYPLERAELLLESLLDAHVLMQHVPGRYTFHDLLREHARATASAEETAEATHAALAGLFGHYLHTASTAVDLLYPYGTQDRPPVPEPGTPAVPFDGSTDEAMTWLDAERGNLVAAGTYTAEQDRDWPAYTGNLAAILRPYLDAHAHHTHALALHTQALHASRRATDKTGEAQALVDLGWVYWRQGRYDQAHEYSRQALNMSRQVGYQVGETRAHNTLGMLYLQRREYAPAHQHLQDALALCREIGNRVGEAHVLGNLGINDERQDRYDQARGHHLQALDLHRELGNRAGEARVLDHLAVVYRRQGRHEEARDHHLQALDLYRELGNRGDEATPLNGLGEAARAMGDPRQAVEHHEAALALARGVGNVPEEARADDGLARAHRDLGATDAAREHARRALAAYTDLGVPEAGEIRAFLDALGG